MCKYSNFLPLFQLWRPRGQNWSASSRGDPSWKQSRFERTGGGWSGREGVTHRCQPVDIGCTESLSPLADHRVEEQAGQQRGAARDPPSRDELAPVPPQRGGDLAAEPVLRPAAQVRRPAGPNGQDPEDGGGLKQAARQEAEEAVEQQGKSKCSQNSS